MSQIPRSSNGRFRKYKIPKPLKIVDLAIPEKPGRPEKAENDYAKIYHKLFTDFSTEILDATRQLFESRPSQLAFKDRDALFKSWIDKSSDSYKITPPHLVWADEADDTGGGFYEISSHRIFMSPSRASVITFLHEFRHALQHKGVEDRVSEDNEIDARAWSLSLYYNIKPNLLKKLVLEGRVFHIDKTVFEE